MKALARTRFLFQCAAVLSVCLLLGSLSAWEYGQIALPTLLAQAGLFGAMSYASYQLSFRRNRRRLKQRILQLRAQTPDKFPQQEHSRAC